MFPIIELSMSTVRASGSGTVVVFALSTRCERNSPIALCVPSSQRLSEIGIELLETVNRL